MSMSADVALHNYLIVGAVLFVLGSVGFLTRRNLILMLLSAEMMLQGVALNLVAFSRYHQNSQGQAFTIFMLTIAACEAALALALVLSLHLRKRTLDSEAWSTLGEEGVSPDVVTTEETTEEVIPATEAIRRALKRPTWGGDPYTTELIEAAKSDKKSLAANEQPAQQEMSTHA